jgi:CDP-6-deoxy-D-xylo-4-hexulose-3-dehydrase
MDKLEAFTDRRRKETSVCCATDFKASKSSSYCPARPSTADPSWFAFILTLREGAPFTRVELAKHLDAALIETRGLFAGNLLPNPVT